MKHYKTTEPPNNRPNGYFKYDFENMMFSENGAWFDTTGTTPHPESEKIYGSFKEYWLQMSKSNLRVGGQVVNPPDQNGVPLWIEADHTRGYYASLPAFSPALANEAIQKAIALGYVSENPGNPNYYDKYSIVYAQHAIYSGALMVNGSSINGRYHFLAERSGPELYGGNLSDKSFTHIGIYAHEFGHTIGFFEEYDGDGNHPSDLKYFCLMARGIYNGPDRKSACPATLSPWYRIDKGWLPEPTLISSDQENFLVEYDYNNPKLYKIDPVGLAADMHYLFEIKKRQGFDSYIPEPPETYQNQSGTLLIWQHNIDYQNGGNDKIRLKTADFNSSKLTQLEDFFPSSTYQNYQSLNDTTYPMASVGADLEEVFPNLIKPAHFALNGIQKLGDGNTQIAEIKPNHAIIKNKHSGSWQLVSVPVGLEDYTVSSVFPTAISVYDINYNEVNVLQFGPGYWAKFQTGLQSTILTGTVEEYIEFPLTSGWNLTGTISDKVPIPNVCTNPAGIIISIWRFSQTQGYTLMTESDSLKPGLGYWTKTSQAGELILDRYAEPCELAKIKVNSQIDFSSMDKFIITDAEGYSQSLYVSNTDIDSSMAGIELDLPPLFDEVDFDSRFEYNEFVKKVSADSGTIGLDILVHTNSYPISLAWELNPENNINYSFIGNTSMGKVTGIESLSGNVPFNSLVNNRIQLVASANKINSSDNIPTEYALYQNYPNPFNPSTHINYSIIKDGLVTLKIFDVLGREVTTLVNEEKTAGTYMINFDASFLSSGTYFYSISSRDFHQTKKMILLK